MFSFFAQGTQSAGPAFPGTLVPKGRVFTIDGAPVRYRGVSGFKLLDLFARDRRDAVASLLAHFAAKGRDGRPGYSAVRVWLYTTWPGTGWSAPAFGTVSDFIRFARDCGYTVALTLLTDDTATRLAWARSLVWLLSSASHDNLLIECGNEPRTNKAILTGALRDALAACPYPHASGDYEDTRRAYGSYQVDHSERSWDWPRKAHNLLDFWEGGGPNDPGEPARHVPAIEDEPIRPDQAPGPLDRKVRDYYAYGATCAILGAGATFHYDGGKFGELPTVEDDACADALLAGLNVFPDDAPLAGAYRRIPEPGAPADQRTYVVGERYMVRVRPHTLSAPEPGWTPQDEWGIAWTR